MPYSCPVSFRMCHTGKKKKNGITHKGVQEHSAKEQTHDFCLTIKSGKLTNSGMNDQWQDEENCHNNLKESVI